MAPPLPDLDLAAARGEEVARLIASLGGLKAAERALMADGTPIRWESLRRYVRGERVAPNDIMAALSRLAADKPRWIIGRDQKRGRWIVHLHKPRFAARIVDGDIGNVDWIDDKPTAHRHGMLLSEAKAMIG